MLMQSGSAADAPRAIEFVPAGIKPGRLRSRSSAFEGNERWGCSGERRRRFANSSEFVQRCAKRLPV